MHDLFSIFTHGLVYKYPVNISSDTAFWSNLKWPAAPNQDDLKVFEQYSLGSILLLGSTKILLSLCTEAWDLHPLYDDPKLKQRDWFSLDKHFNTVIIDGGLSYGEQFTKNLLKVILPNCDRFVSRTFLNPNWPTKYAVYFPCVEDLDPRPQEHPINEVYTFYIWNNRQY